MNQYPGEQLAYGQAGELLLLFSFLSVLLAAVFASLYVFKRKGRQRLLMKGAGIAYVLHTLFLVLASLVFLMIIHLHLFEYNYVWRYTAMSLSPGYLFSAMWAGREGSMLLWALLSACSGLFLLRRFYRNMPSVLILSVIQLAFLWMLNGAFFSVSGSGLEPFRLLRETSDFMSSSLAGIPEYLSYISDGNGLNPLLQNPWMVIHPPVLFMGYALCGLLFSVALPLLRQKYHSRRLFRMKRIAVAAAAVLGAGLLLGGVWAYEDLTFGGFWAWDPVENASLIPWLLLVAGLHLLPSSQKQAAAVPTAVFLMALPFVLSLYASWLTRSGILSATSVHAFSGDHKASELLLMTLASFLFVCLSFVSKRKFSSSQDDAFFSRDFFLFLSAVVILLSAFQIFFTTSYPVWNLLFGASLTLPPDQAAFYNIWQLPFAVAILLLVALTASMKSGANSFRKVMEGLLVPLSASVILSLLIFIFSAHMSPGSLILLWAALFAVLGIVGSRLNGQHRPGFSFMLIHTGFGLFMASVVVAFGMSGTVVPSDSSGVMRKDVVPLVKGDVVQLSDGKWVSYSGSSISEGVRTYKLDFLKRNDEKYFLLFSLKPAIRMTDNMGDVMLPAVKSGLKGDFFVYLTEAGITRDSFAPASRYDVKAGDTLSIPQGRICAADSFITDENKDVLTFQPAGSQRIYTLLPGNEIQTIPESRIQLAVAQMSDSTATVNLFSEIPDYIVVKIRTFPLIGLLWLASFMMLSGMLALTFRRRKR
jgi:cytochrome c-type biogenesis protein CcmF